MAVILDIKFKKKRSHFQHLNVECSHERNFLNLRGWQKFERTSAKRVRMR